jgi:hypothetical protein
VKTTVEISDALFKRAKRHALKTHRPMRALIEEGLRRVLDDPAPAERYQLPDRSLGEPGAHNPLEQSSWGDLRDEIYGGR